LQFFFVFKIFSFFLRKTSQNESCIVLEYFEGDCTTCSY